MGSAVKCAGNRELNKVIPIALRHSCSEPFVNLQEEDIMFSSLGNASLAMKAVVFKVLTWQKKKKCNRISIYKLQLL